MLAGFARFALPPYGSGDVNLARLLVSRASIAVIFAETDARSVRVIVDAGNHRELAHTTVTRGVELCGKIQITCREVIQQGRLESVIVVEPGHVTVVRYARRVPVDNRGKCVLGERERAAVVIRQ